MLFAALLATLFGTAPIVVAQVAPAAVPACDAACLADRSKRVAAAFSAAAESANNLVVAECYRSWAAFDRHVSDLAAAGKMSGYGPSPHQSPSCQTTLQIVAEGGNTNGPSVNTQFAASSSGSGSPLDFLTFLGQVGTAQSALTSGAAALTAASSAASTASSLSNMSGLASSIGSLGNVLGGLGDLFGSGGNADDRPGFDQGVFDQISANAGRIFSRLEPYITYIRVSTYQNSLNLAEEAPATVAVAPPPAAPAAVAVAPPAFGASLMQRAQQGDAQSQFAVGLEYLHGDGVPRDTVLAYKWLKLASLGGVSAASSLARDAYAHLDESGRAQGTALVAAARNDPRSR
jgi:hypothetical protein